MARVGKTLKVALPDGRIDTVTVYAVKPKYLCVDSPMLGHAYRIYQHTQIYKTITVAQILEPHTGAVAPEEDRHE